MKVSDPVTYTVKPTALTINGPAAISTLGRQQLTYNYTADGGFGNISVRVCRDTALGRMPNSFSCSTPVAIGHIDGVISGRADELGSGRITITVGDEAGHGDPDGSVVGVRLRRSLPTRRSAGHQRDGRADGRAAPAHLCRLGLLARFECRGPLLRARGRRPRHHQLGIRAHLRGPRHPQRAHAGLPRHRDLRRRRQQQGDDDLHRQRAESGHESLVGRFDHRDGGLVRDDAAVPLVGRQWPAHGSLVLRSAAWFLDGRDANNFGFTGCSTPGSASSPGSSRTPPVNRPARPSPTSSTLRPSWPGMTVPFRVSQVGTTRTLFPFLGRLGARTVLSVSGNPQGPGANGDANNWWLAGSASPGSGYSTVTFGDSAGQRAQSSQYWQMSYLPLSCSVDGPGYGIAGEPTRFPTIKTSGGFGTVTMVGTASTPRNMAPTCTTSPDGQGGTTASCYFSSNNPYPGSGRLTVDFVDETGAAARRRRTGGSIPVPSARPTTGPSTTSPAPTTTFLRSVRPAGSGRSASSRSRDSRRGRARVATAAPTSSTAPHSPDPAPRPGRSRTRPVSRRARASSGASRGRRSRSRPSPRRAWCGSTAPRRTGSCRSSSPVARVTRASSAIAMTTTA